MIASATFVPLASPRTDAPAAAQPDSAQDLRLRAQALARVQGRTWWDAERSNIWVRDGRILCQGLLPRGGDGASRSAARSALASLPGARDVLDARRIGREG